MKKLLALLLALSLVMAVCPAWAEELVDETAEDEVFYSPDYDYDSLTVAGTTRMTGNFSGMLWSSNTADQDVNSLITGYSLVSWLNNEGRFQVSPQVVSGIAQTTDAQGNKTFVITLYDDLRYSDGSIITARDYAFSILLAASGAIAELGGTPIDPSCIVGVQDYRDGLTDRISGVSIISDTQLNITISAAYLPFFYELGLLNFAPYPIAEILPGRAVRDDGEGAYVDGGMTVEDLKQNLLGDNGYLTHPHVVSGPYTLESFDGTTATLKVNPYYKGTDDGRTPRIETLVYTYADNASLIPALRDGELGLVNKVTYLDTVAEGQQLMSEGDFEMAFYPRTGASFIQFCCESPAVADVAVRQAIALCFDKDAAAAAYTGTNGMRVDGYYGLGQWMYQALNGTLNLAAEGEVDKWDALDMSGIRAYALNIDEAKSLLDASGWAVNASGIREKDGVALQLTLIYPETNAIDAILTETLVNPLREAGIELTLAAMPFEQLLKQYYRQEARTADMIYLATNFELVFDPALTFSPDDALTGFTNCTAIADQQLYDLALDMRRTEPSDVLGYVTKWIAFQQRFQEVVPAIGVYSNVYFDFYTAHLTDYTPTADITWGLASVGAYMNDISEDISLFVSDDFLFE